MKYNNFEQMQSKKKERKEEKQQKCKEKMNVFQS